MAENQAVTTPEKKAAQTTTTALLPTVDVYEDEYGITLLADLPGVAREKLNLQADQDTLTIEGDLAFTMPENIQPLYADVRFTRYRRSFALSHDLDASGIEANLKDGVLTVRLPKKKALQPRKITIQTS